MKWGLPSSVENSVSDDALSEELVIDVKINGIIPNSGILDRPSVVFADDTPTIDMDGKFPCVSRDLGRNEEEN